MLSSARPRGAALGLGLTLGRAEVAQQAHGAARCISTSALARQMQAAGVQRGYIVWDAKRRAPAASHAVLQPLLEYVRQDRVDYKEHEGLFFEAYEDCLFGAFVWRTQRGQSCGGIRLRKYDSAESWMVDGMRLAIGMGRKSALAGLWWGGGKGVIAAGEDAGVVSDAARREQMLRAYGRFVTSLRGCYVGAEDAGICVADMDVVYQTTRFLTCISPALGGSGNPSVPTAMGIVSGMEGALAALDMGGLRGKSVAVQGVGNVGGPLVKFLLDKGVARVVAADVDTERCAQVLRDNQAHKARLTVHVSKDYPILEEQVDILSPCAFGGVLNERSVPRIRAKIVCGAANNQLLDPSTDYGMSKRGVVYAPDFVVNRMGIVSCADEGLGRVGEPGGVEDPLVAKHLDNANPQGVYQVVKDVIKRAARDGVSTASMAEKMADEAVVQTNPLYGHRSLAIINRLVLDGWATSK
jgi:glutamate dehydrogenase/leucine dehydrogenase